MKTINWYNIARAMGERACKAVLSGGFQAAYEASPRVTSDTTARTLRTACVAFVCRKAPVVVKTAVTVKTTPTVKVVGLNWLIALMVGVKALPLFAVQRESWKPGSLNCTKAFVPSATVSFTAATRRSMIARKKAIWATIVGFKAEGYVVDMAFRAERAVVFKIAAVIASAKDVITAAKEAAAKWIAKAEANASLEVLNNLDAMRQEAALVGAV